MIKVFEFKNARQAFMESEENRRLVELSQELAKQQRKQELENGIMIFIQELQKQINKSILQGYHSASVVIYDNMYGCNFTCTELETIIFPELIDFFKGFGYGINIHTYSTSWYSKSGKFAEITLSWSN